MPMQKVRRACRGRRRFLKGAIAAGTLPAAGLVLGPRPARAEDRPRAEDGHAWDYVNHAADAADHPEYEEGEICANCIFWAEEIEDGWGECMHPDFEDVLVNAQGWCAAYVAAET
jgi:hypothetical protein